jgi:spore germination cell wall hydrolase CwlJ-like protein
LDFDQFVAVLGHQVLERIEHQPHPPPGDCIAQSSALVIWQPSSKAATHARAATSSVASGPNSTDPSSPCVQRT